MDNQPTANDLPAILDVSDVNVDLEREVLTSFTAPIPQSRFFPITFIAVDEPEDDDDDQPANEPSAIPLATLPQSSPPPHTAIYLRALHRVAALHTYLTPNMQSSLNSLLFVVQNHLHVPASPSLSDSSHSLVIRIASPATPDTTLYEMASTIDAGLHAFAARGGRPTTQNPPLPGSKAKSSSRSTKVRAGCQKRDHGICCVSGRRAGESSHIIPFSLNIPSKGVDYWKFIAMFHGVRETEELKLALFGPNGNVDTLSNVWFLSKDVHDLFDKGLLAIIPVLTESQFPYDPRTLASYQARVEFPVGIRDMQIAVWDTKARRTPRIVKPLEQGDYITFTTVDPEHLPLPSPLLFQLHALTARVMAMKAAAGFPVITHYDSDDADTASSLGEWAPAEDDAWEQNRSGKRALETDDDDLVEYQRERPRKFSLVLAEFVEQARRKRQLAWDKFGMKLGVRV